MKAKIYFTFLLITSVGVLRAQQTPLFNSALINPLLENPSLVGMNKYAQSFLHYRQQWLDIEGAPESAKLTIDWPLKDEKSGLAVALVSDKINIVGNIGVMAAYSHNIKISDDQNLRLGLGLQLNHNTIYFDKVQAEYEFESALFNYFESATGLHANFGLSYNYKALKAGFSITNMVNSKLQYSNATEDKSLYFQYVPQYYLNVNYDYAINEEFSVLPGIGLRDIQGMPLQVEANVLASYLNKYSAGMIYRNKNSVAALVSVVVYDRLLVSYAYEAALGELNSYNGATHEITLGYRFFTTHYQEYKPVDNQKIDELIQFSEKQIENNKKLESDNQRLKEEQEKLSEELKKEKEEIKKLIEIMMAERENNKQVQEEDETELEDLPEDLIHDPDVPIYITLGVFSNTNSAKKYQQVLLREHQLSTKVLKRRDSQDYIVCVNRKYDSKKSLQRELTRLKRITAKYSDLEAWIYVIQ